VIIMTPMSQMCAMFTVMIERCMAVVGGDRSGLLLMIATVVGSLVVVMCTAMVARMPTRRTRRHAASQGDRVDYGRDSFRVPMSGLCLIVRHDLRSVKVVFGDVLMKFAPA
jgi:hypothetical protein